ncbi:hypothetical protein HEP74_01618 [Xanthomonas sp. SS]|nr:hypothetical protein HEP74_01618 [Xanthomonas sp. SS]
MSFNSHGSAKDAGIEHHADANDVIEIAYATVWKSR